MVIQTNEQEFKGKTLQEYLEWKYPTKEDKEGVKRIEFWKIFTAREGQSITKKLEGGELDLREFVNLTCLECPGSNFPSLNVSGCSNLISLNCSGSNLTSVDFLNDLPNPEKLRGLSIFGNNIQSTDISIFSRFINLEYLKIGNVSGNRVKYNRFYGSLKSYQNLTKLQSICIEATDVNEGLEYLPASLAQKSKGGAYYIIECSPHETNAKCKAIQDQLRPFNYDLEAWQLAHPEKMLIARPEYFTNPDSKEQWLQALKDKIKQSQEALDYIIKNEPNKEAKIVRLETQIKILEEVMEQEREIHSDSMKAMDNFYQQNPPQENILQEFEKNYLELNRENQQKEQENRELKKTIEITEKILEQEYQPKETREQGTQTDLSSQDYEQQQKENQELREQINQLTVKKGK